MKSLLYGLVFVLGGVAFADQPPKPETEVVEFSVLQGLAVCVFHQQSVNCESDGEQTKATVTIEKLADHENYMVGHIDLNTAKDGYEHVTKITIIKQSFESDMSYVFSTHDSYKSSTLSDGKTAYGEIIVDTTVSNLNTVVFYNEGEQIGEKYIFPYTLIAPLTADGKVMRANVLRKLANDITRKLLK